MPTINKSVGDVLATAVMKERAGAPVAPTAQEAIAAILKDGVTHAERSDVAQMLHNLEHTPHAGLAKLIFEGVTKGGDANFFQELKEKITGPATQGATPSVTWKENVPNAAEQAKWNTEITNRQIALSQVNGVVDRGFHAKQIFGGAVSVKINANLPPEAKIEPFWDVKNDKPANLDGVARFSNGQGCPFKDSGPDVRGLAIKLVDGAGQPWDTLTTNKQTFAEDVPQFIGFAKASTAAELRSDDPIGELKQSAILAGEIGPIQSTRITTQLLKDTVLHNVNDLTTESYDGGTFRTKDGHLAKILFTPVPGAVETMTRHDVKNDDNGLTTGLNRHFQSGPVKFRVQLKLYAGVGDETKANDRWEPSKIIDIGEMSIKQPPKDKATDALVQKLTNSMRFNPGNGFDPAGQMTRARGEQKGVNGDKVGIYQTSANNRLAFNDGDKGIAAALKSVSSGAPDTAQLTKIAGEIDRRHALLADLQKSGKATPDVLDALFKKVTAEWNGAGDAAALDRAYQALAKK